MERRDGIGAKALEGRGKRAAFALFYGPLHFLTVREIVRALAAPKAALVLDLGCGTGATGAAYSVEAGGRLQGVDRNGWTLEEARFTLAGLGLEGKVTRGDLTREELPGKGNAVVAGWSINELDGAGRAAMLPRLLASGAALLVVEPIARRPVPWWDSWAQAFRGAGGRSDEWRFPMELPDILSRLDQAAKLDHRVLTARSLFRP